MKTIELSEQEAQWLEDALYELKGLRGWAWDEDDMTKYEDIESQLQL